MKNPLQKNPHVKVNQKVDDLNAQVAALMNKDVLRAIELSEEAHKLAKSGAYQSGEADSILNLSIGNDHLSNYEVALPLSFEALRLFEQLRHVKGQCQAAGIIGKIYTNLGNYAAALHYLLRSLETYEKLEDREGQAMAQNRIAEVHKDAGDFDKALDFLFKSLTIIQKMDNQEKEADILGRIGIVFGRAGDYAQAMTYLQQGLTIVQAINLRYEEAKMLDNIGRCQRETGEYEEALENFLQSLDHYQCIGYQYGIVATLYHVATVYLKQNLPNKALAFLSQAAEISLEINTRPQLAKIHKAQAEAYRQLGDFEAALSYHDRFYEIKEQVFDKDSQNLFKNFKICYGVQKKEQEIRQLQQQLISKRKELATLIRNLATKNELIQELHQEVQKLESGSNQTKGSLLENVLTNFKESTTLTWPEFQGQFDQVYPGFIQKLAGRCADLTRQELKISALIKIELTTQEIANLLYLAYRSVESHRHHIRKKLKLPSSQSLNDFLATV